MQLNVLFILARYDVDQGFDARWRGDGIGFRSHGQE
jgi:hypothetical protein